MFASRGAKGHTLLIVKSSWRMPPVDTAGKYVSYHEARSGDRWFFIGDRRAKTAVLYGTDIETPRAVTAENPYPNIVFLSRDEQVWLVACVMACFDVTYEEAVGRYNRGAKDAFEDAEAELARREAAGVA